MVFVGKEKLPEAVKRIIEQKENYICYLRAYYSGGRYGSRLFYNGAANGTISQIAEAEAIGRQKYTDALREATKTVCEELFEINNPSGKWQFLDFCKRCEFDKTEDGYIGYTYLAHSAFVISVSEHDEYFCRVYVYER